MIHRVAKAVGGGLLLAFASVAVGSTASSPTGAADAGPTVVRGGSLLLDLGPGGAGATLGFDRLEPGGERSVQLWVLSNDLLSTVPAELAMTVDRVADVPAACAGNAAKAQGELDSGIAGCSVVDGVATGTPAQGNLSRLLAFDIRYAPKTGDRCAARPGGTLIDAVGPGDLQAVRGRTTVLAGPDGAGPLLLAPGDAVCVSVMVRWPDAGAAAGSPDHPVDNAAQGDSLTLGVRFDLTQVVG